MSGANFSVQHFSGSRFKLSAAWAICLADLLHRNMRLLFTVKIHCQTSVSFFQDSSFNWGLKRKGHLFLFPFLLHISTLSNLQKIIGYFQY